HAAPHGEVFVDVPYRFAGSRVPGIQPAALAAGTSIHPHARADVRRPGDVVRLESLIIHAVVRVGDVEPAGHRRERTRRLVLAAGRGRADATGHHALFGAIRRILSGPSCLAIDAVSPVGEYEFPGGDHFPGFAVERIDESIAIGMHEDFALATVHLNVGED